MATPAAAGVALLVRQYFSDDRFWAAVCRSSYRSCRAFTPTGVLVKAMLIHSAVGLYLYNGGDVDDILLNAPPDFMQGYGRIRMDSAMPLKGTITGFDLFVADAVNIPEYSNVPYSVQITNSDKPLKYVQVSY